MITGRVGTPNFEAMFAKLSRAGNLTLRTMRPLLERTEVIMIESNRRKVLGGLDGKGRPMTPTSYRFSAAISPSKTRPHHGEARGINFAPFNPGANGNLTTKEYKLLTGPPLAPRGERSRVITNLETAIGEASGGFYVTKGWTDIVSAKGVHFLMSHFRGSHITGPLGSFQLPVRDLRGVDAKEIEEFHVAVRDWFKMLMAGDIR